MRRRRWTPHNGSARFRPNHDRAEGRVGHVRERSELVASNNGADGIPSGARTTRSIPDRGILFRLVDPDRVERIVGTEKDRGRGGVGLAVRIAEHLRRAEVWGGNRFLPHSCLLAGRGAEHDRRRVGDDARQLRAGRPGGHVVQDEQRGAWRRNERILAGCVTLGGLGSVPGTGIGLAAVQGGRFRARAGPLRRNPTWLPRLRNTLLDSGSRPSTPAKPTIRYITRILHA